MDVPIAQKHFSDCIYWNKNSLHIMPGNEQVIKTEIWTLRLQIYKFTWIKSTRLSKCPKDLTTRCYLMTQARLCWGWDQQVTETKRRIFSSVGISSGKPPASRETDAALKTKWAPAEATASSVSARKDLTLLITQSCLTLCDPWTVARQAPLSMEFSGQEYWSGLSLASPSNAPNPGIEPGSSALQAGSSLPEPPDFFL